MSGGIRSVRLGVATLAVSCVAVLWISASAARADPGWAVAGQGADDNRYQPDETTINAANVAELAPKWVFTTAGDVSATPTVAGGVVYFPDWGGNLYALNEATGREIWQQSISSYDGVPGAVSRVSPAIYYDPQIGGDELILGDNLPDAHSTGAEMFGVNAATGQLLWKTTVESHPAAIITGNPTIAGSMAIVGVSSNEEDLATDDGYPCCTFRGSVVALNAITGQIVWKTYTVPPNNGPCTSSDPMKGCGYSGASVWSTPAYDAADNTVYVGTGNNYTTPSLPAACETLSILLHFSNKGCTRNTDYFEAILALNADTGAVEWATKVSGWDAFTAACANHLPGVTWCPTPRSPDYDFGSGPNVISVTGSDGLPETLIGVGQKSGVYWALNAQTGAIVWSRLAGPGSALGGIVWGTAYDGRSIYVPETDFSGMKWTLLGGPKINNGAWSAINPVTGTLEWQTQVPDGGLAYGPVSAANGVVYGGSSAPSGANMFAIDAATGQILWSYASGGSTASSPAIVDGNLFWGSGYGMFASAGFTGNDLFYDFSLNGS